MSWFVLNVKRNQENVVSQTLEKMNIEVFNPVIKQVNYLGGQKRTIENSLFQSYIFLNIPERYRGIVFGISGVNTYLFLNGKPALVQDEEINILKNWVAQGSNDLAILSKLMSRKEIGSENWLLNNNTEALKWVSPIHVPDATEEQEVVKHKVLRKVV